MDSLSGGRQRWTLERRRREPSLYDEWLNQEKPSSQHQQNLAHAVDPVDSSSHHSTRFDHQYKECISMTKHYHQQPYPSPSPPQTQPPPPPTSSSPPAQQQHLYHSEIRSLSQSIVSSSPAPVLKRRESVPFTRVHIASREDIRGTIRAVTPDLYPSSAAHTPRQQPSRRAPQDTPLQHRFNSDLDTIPARYEDDDDHEHEDDDEYDDNDDDDDIRYAGSLHYTPSSDPTFLPSAVEHGADHDHARSILETTMASSLAQASAERQPFPIGMSTADGEPASIAHHDLIPDSLESTPRSSARRAQNVLITGDRDRDPRYAMPTTPLAVKNGTKGGSLRIRSRSQLEWLEREQAVAAATANAARPRTRTLDERPRQEFSTPSSTIKSRNRNAVVPTSSYQTHGAEYLASVPALTSLPTAPSISSLGSPVQPPDEIKRSVSPMSSDTTPSLTSHLPSANARRITHLMKTLSGKMSGNVIFRRGTGTPWNASYCSISEETTSLVYEVRNGESTHHTLVSELRGCMVRADMEADMPHLELRAPQAGTEVHIRLTTQADFNAWFAAFLYWQHQIAPPEEVLASRNTSGSTAPEVVTPELPPRPASARQRERTNSVTNANSVRRQSAVASLKEAPVIKIGKMIFWDTRAGFGPSVATTQLGQPSTSRPEIRRLQSYGSKRWQRISGQLRENGELKLHADADNSLISIVQLSQLSRCAIQRLDYSVLDCDFCIAIYPQYTATPSNTQAASIRPLFLSLENRVLYEVWFVLLRAFTIPQLYGPSNAIDRPADEDGDDQRRDLEQLLVTTTTDMFRVQRSLTVRVVEAKIYASTNVMNNDHGNHGKSSHTNKSNNDAYFAEISLDNETRGKTSVKREGLNPLWSETFEFLDLPSVLSSASVLIKRRPLDIPGWKDSQEARAMQDPYSLSAEQTGGVMNVSCDVTCGKVEIHIQELEETEKEVERWWPIINAFNIQVGEVLIKARAEEGVILMARDYKPLGDLLHRFSNSLPLHIAQMVNGELKRLSDCLLNIYQVSGRVCDWLIALVEEEIDGLHKESNTNRFQYGRRTGSNENVADVAAPSSSHGDRELIVRDMNRSATVEANLLFRGNTLLTKSLDAHMRRVGKEYLEESLAAKIQEINDKDPHCEVDPNRMSSVNDSDRTRKRLMHYTQEVWKAIVSAKHRCPLELRVIFRHIRACAEDRYGDFLRTVSYSSVSGFLFLRFFCPAVLNPKLFALVKVDIKPRARRTLTLIAKSLQTLANMATFGTKEHWMVPMNSFLVQHRESFKTFIDDICYVPPQQSSSIAAYSPSTSPRHPQNIVSMETHLSYTTPMTIMQRLPPTSREGFPSLPYLLDQARAYADLVQLWLEVVNPAGSSNGVITSSNAKRRSDVLRHIGEVGGDLAAFHDICIDLNTRTQDCLSRAERAERPTSSTSFPWEDLIDQLQSKDGHVPRTEESTMGVGDAADRPDTMETFLPPSVHGSSGTASPGHRSVRWGRGVQQENKAQPQQSYTQSSTASDITHSFEHIPSVGRSADRPGSSGLHAAASNFTGNIRRVLQSRGSDHSPSASTSNISSTVTSDAEHTTALPSYDREVRRHHERREAAKAQIQQQVEEAKAREREKEKDKRKRVPWKKRERDDNSRRTASAGVP